MEARKIIITGGATRMGAAIARKLSGPNIEILIHYNKSKLKVLKCFSFASLKSLPKEKLPKTSQFDLFYRFPCLVDIFDSNFALFLLVSVSGLVVYVLFYVSCCLSAHDACLPCFPPLV